MTTDPIDIAELRRLVYRATGATCAAPISCSQAMALLDRLERAEAERDYLQRFKDLTHRLLDEMGVDRCEGAGGWIKARLDWLAKTIAFRAVELNKEREKAEAERAQARRTSQFHKDNALAAEAELSEARHEMTSAIERAQSERHTCELAEARAEKAEAEAGRLRGLLERELSAHRRAVAVAQSSGHDDYARHFQRHADALAAALADDTKGTK